jgi:signal transduction histidine kinase/ActR/RegA family two-component response regulator
MNIFINFTHAIYLWREVDMENIDQHITELKKIISSNLHESFRADALQYLERIENASRSKAYFLAMMSHEIRTPMSGVLGVADLLQDTVLNSKQKYLVDTIKLSAENILTLMNDILDFSKLEYGKFSLNMNMFDLFACVENSLKLFAPIALEKNLDLSYNIRKGVPSYIISDEKRIRQILVNLLSNALKHTDKGEIVLTVEKKSLRDNIVELLFTVKDSGHGIPAENIDKLFKPFEQAGENFSGQYSGTGLGLAISKQLVELLDGEIWVESTFGKGSSFSFIIKAGISSENHVELDNDKSMNTGRKNISPLAEQYPFNILVAEDNIINRKLILKILENMGYKAEVAENGIKVLEAMTNSSYDIILMDIQMPEMDGYEATRQICKKFDKTSRPYIIAITANAMQDDRNKCIEAGMDDYLTKPIRKDEIYAVLERVGKTRSC